MQRDFEENSNGVSYLQVGGLFDLKDMLSFPANRLLELLSQCGDGNFFEKIVDYEEEGGEEFEDAKNTVFAFENKLLYKIAYWSRWSGFDSVIENITENPSEF